MLLGMQTWTAEQFDVLSELSTVQARITRRDIEQQSDLTWREQLVRRAQDLGVSQSQVAAHIGMKSGALRQAGLRERRRLKAAS